jgi:hypothetical protein
MKNTQEEPAVDAAQELEKLIDTEISLKFDSNKVESLSAEDSEKYKTLSEIFKKNFIEFENLKKELTEKKYVVTNDTLSASYIYKFVEKDIKAVGKENKGHLLLYTAVLESYKTCINTPKNETPEFVLRGMDLKALEFFANKYESTSINKSQSFVLNLYSPMEEALSLLEKDLNIVKTKESELNTLEGDITILLEGLQEPIEDGTPTEVETVKSTKTKKTSK